MGWPPNLIWKVPDISPDFIFITYLVQTEDIYNRKNQYFDLKVYEKAVLFCVSVIIPSALTAKTVAHH